VTGCHVREELGAYVLGALDPGEHDAVSAHLRECAECREERDRLAALPPLIAHADGLEIPAPPPAIEERLLDRVAASRPHRRTHRRLRFNVRTALVAGLAGLLLGTAATAFALSLGDDGGGEAAQARTYQLALAGTSGATGGAKLQPGRGGTEVHLWVRGLPPGSKAVYEVRCEGARWSASAGTFRADDQGRAVVDLSTAARVGEYERIRVVRGDESVLTGSLN
jgi:hypothetical protein